VARAALSQVIALPTIVHCCAADVPVTLLREAGAAAVGVDLGLVADLDAFGEAIDGGMALVAGVADPMRPAPPSAELADRVWRFWRRLGFPDKEAAERVAVAPACGLAGTTETNARALLAACREAGQRLRDASE
jgi:methionine synthase II (cobalamin-independent)